MGIRPKLRTAFIALAVTVVLSAPAFAWNDAGHRIIASIAYWCLTPDQRRAVIKRLEQHPRFAADFQGRMPVELDRDAHAEWLFQQAALWPDLARGFPAELKETYHRGQWHYINLPHFLSDEERRALDGKLSVNVSLDPPARTSPEMNVIQTLRAARQLVGERNQP